MRQDIVFVGYIRDLANFYTVNIDDRERHEMPPFGNTLKSKMSDKGWIRARRARGVLCFHIHLFCDFDKSHRFSYHFWFDGEAPLEYYEGWVEKNAPEEYIEQWEQLKQEKITPLRKELERECAAVRNGTWGEHVKPPGGWTIN